jgi:hypothetical protein
MPAPWIDGNLRQPSGSPSRVMGWQITMRQP